MWHDTPNRALLSTPHSATQTTWALKPQDHKHSSQRQQHQKQTPTTKRNNKTVKQRYVSKETCGVNPWPGPCLACSLPLPQVSTWVSLGKEKSIDRGFNESGNRGVIRGLNYVCFHVSPTSAIYIIELLGHAGYRIKLHRVCRVLGTRNSVVTRVMCAPDRWDS